MTQFINKSTERAKAIIKAYQWAQIKGYISLYDVYVKPSQNKINALETIKARTNFNIRTFFIVSYNCNVFTCAYITKENYLIYDTAKHSIVIDLN